MLQLNMEGYYIVIIITRIIHLTNNPVLKYKMFQRFEIRMNPVWCVLDHEASQQLLVH